MIQIGVSSNLAVHVPVGDTEWKEETGKYKPTHFVYQQCCVQTHRHTTLTFLTTRSSSVSMTTPTTYTGFRLYIWMCGNMCRWFWLGMMVVTWPRFALVMRHDPIVIGLWVSMVRHRYRVELFPSNRPHSEALTTAVGTGRWTITLFVKYIIYNTIYNILLNETIQLYLFIFVP
jgi:hypothetical protein